MAFPAGEPGMTSSAPPPPQPDRLRTANRIAIDKNVAFDTTTPRLLATLTFLVQQPWGDSKYVLVGLGDSSHRCEESRDNAVLVMDLTLRYRRLKQEFDCDKSPMRQCDERRVLAGKQSGNRSNQCMSGVAAA